MPHGLRLPAVAGLVLAIAIALASSFTHAAADPQLDSEEQAFVTLINNYRAAQNPPLGALTIDWQIQPASEWMSTDMGINSYFDHNDHCIGDCVNGHQYSASASRDPWTRMCQIGGYCYNTWKGENIAAGFNTAQSVFTAWQNSPGHNANMLGTHYTTMGVARVYTVGSTYGWYWTNDFGGYRSNATPPPRATNTSSPTPTPTPVPSPTPTPAVTPSPTQLAGAGCLNAVPVSLIPGDSDCDGFPDGIPAAGRASEAELGTDPTRACPSTSTPDDEPSPDAWPVDFNDDRIVNGQDAGKFAPAFNKLVSDGPFGPDNIPGDRFDLNGNGIINGQDTGKFQTYFNKICS